MIVPDLRGQLRVLIRPSILHGLTFRYGKPDHIGRDEFQQHHETNFEERELGPAQLRYGLAVSRTRGVDEFHDQLSLLNSQKPTGFIEVKVVVQRIQVAYDSLNHLVVPFEAFLFTDLHLNRINFQGRIMERLNLKR